MAEEESSHEISQQEDPPQFGSAEWRIQKGITVRRAAWGRIVNQSIRHDPHAFEPISEEEAARDASGIKKIVRRILDEPILSKNRKKAEGNEEKQD